MLRPSDGVNNRPGLLHVAGFTNRSIEVSGFEELFFGNAGDALNHLWRVATVMLLQKLKDTIGVLQREIVSEFFRQRQSRRRRSRFGMSGNLSHFLFHHGFARAVGARIIPRGLVEVCVLASKPEKTPSVSPGN